MQKCLPNSILDYPHSLESNSAFRVELLDDAQQDINYQEALRVACHDDIIFWINLFCWTKDPRKTPDVIPFICYESYQEKYIKEIESAIDNQEDLLTEKTRDMGVSWMILYVFTHKWLFERGSDFRVGSRKEEFVDKLGDIDTLLEKVRFNLLKQPLWLLPQGFNPDEHCGFMRIINPVSGNAIIGESANEYFGSGGRRKAILLDEFAKWEEKVAESAWTSTHDVTKCRLAVSTPTGSANKFAQLASGTKEKIKKATLHWTLHPEKSKGAYYDNLGQRIPISDSQAAFKLFQSGVRVRSPWYDAECERRSEADVAQELDIDYLRSGHPFFNLIELSKQRAWQYFQRISPQDPIPYGKFIRMNLVEIDGKIEIREHPDGWLRVFEFPKVDYQYVVSGDVSEGLVKGDECFLVVRDKISRNVVACANGLYKPTDDFDIMLRKVARYYNKAIIACENNNHGYATNQNLLTNGDCNLYYTERKNEEGKVTSRKAGWTTDGKSRPEMLDQLEEEIRQGLIELRDETLIAQCKTFVRNARTGKPEADGDFLDDGVITTAIGGAVIKEKPYRIKETSPSANRQRAVEDAQKSYKNPFKG